MSFVRTVLGDIDAADLGATYAHEHLVIDGGRPVELFPDFLLADVDRMIDEVRAATAIGLRAVVDAMPIDAGRNVHKLAEISRRTGVHVIAPTGMHHARYYPDDHWSTRASEDELAATFVREVTDGIDASNHRAGVVKIAGSDGGPSARDTPIFAAAANAHLQTGVPILTHCEAGGGGLEQMLLLADHGVDPGHVVLSHVDKVVDRAYHRELLATGAFLEYDQAFRWGDAANGTLALLGWAVEDGRRDRIVLGMDAARRGYYRAYGGQPGLGFLLGAFSETMAAAGLDERIQRGLFVDNPARAFSFATPEGGRG